jgi:hypothetical protein
MSLSDIGWRRLLYVGAGLSLVAVAVLIFLVIPPFKKDIIPGSEWILIGIQLSISFVIFGIGYSNRRGSWLTKTLLIIIGVGAILMCLLGLLAPAMETEMTSVWKYATRLCAIVEMIIAFIAFYACV